jgi:hypothetical protein
MTAVRFVTVAQSLTSRRGARRPYRLDTPGRPLGSIPLFRSTPG